MTLTVLIAAFNERATIEQLMGLVLAQEIVTEVIVTDDGSTDGTREWLETAAQREPRVTVLLHPHNQGKGAAIRAAIPHATSDICIIQDADLEYFPTDYPAVIAPIISGQTRVVYGSRVLCEENVQRLDKFRLGSAVVTQAANILYSTQLTDEPTCYKAFETRFLKSLPLEANGFELCPELTAWSRKNGEQIIEVPIRYIGRSVKDGKKIRWQDGVRAVWTLLRLRLR